MRFTCGSIFEVLMWWCGFGGGKAKQWLGCRQADMQTQHMCSFHNLCDITTEKQRVILAYCRVDE